jgi:hypothetical protein
MSVWGPALLPALVHSRTCTGVGFRHPKLTVILAIPVNAVGGGSVYTEPLTMPVLTETQFKAQTMLSAKGLRRGQLRNIRGTNIRRIDRCCAAYDLVRYGNNAANKAAALTALLAECAHWLKLKKLKTGTSTVSRRGVITQLANDAFTRLRALNSATGVDFYNLNKAIAAGGLVNYNTKALGGGYIHERNFYLASQKAQDPPAASALHRTHKSLGDTGFPRGFNTPESQNMMNTSFKDLTQADFALLDQIHTRMGGAEQVQFADKTSRANNLMVVYQGYNADFEDVNGAAFDTQADPNGFMYAMDEYGTLFAGSAATLLAGHAGTFWNHSSFNAGKDVICAGVIQIHAGVLQYVDNDSGHYQPTRDHLHQLITIFSGEGIALAGVTVKVREPALTPKHINEHTLNAANFLANVNLQDPNFQTVAA